MIAIIIRRTKIMIMTIINKIIMTIITLVL